MSIEEIKELQETGNIWLREAGQRVLCIKGSIQEFPKYEKQLIRCL